MTDLEYSANGSHYVCFLLSDKSKKKIREMLHDDCNDFFSCQKEFFSRFILGLKGTEIPYKQIYENARTLH